MKLGVGQNAVIHLDSRTVDPVTAARVIATGKKVSLPMLMIHRFRIVRQKRRAGQGARRQNQLQANGQ